jgi:hypothetical protein
MRTVAMLVISVLALLAPCSAAVAQTKLALGYGAASAWISSIASIAKELGVAIGTLTLDQVLTT